MVTVPTFHLEFHHIGAKCPACGYVFTNGFSGVDMPGAAYSGRKHPITPCTRCRRVLEVNDAGPRVLDPVELLLLSDLERSHLAYLETMLDDYTKSWT